MKLIPIYRPETAGKFAFASTELGHVEGDTWVSTGALKFGCPIDILGISTSDELIASGVQDHTDCIDQRDFAIDKIYYYDKDTTDPVADIKCLGADVFSSIKLRPGESPRTIHGGCEIEVGMYNGHTQPNVQFHASLDLQVGRLLVTISPCKSMEFVGFTIDGERYNPNRRPVGTQTSIALKQLHEIPMNNMGTSAERTLRSLKAILTFAETMGQVRDLAQEINLDLTSEEDVRRLSEHPKMVWLINWARAEIDSTVDRVVRTAQEAFPRS